MRNLRSLAVLGAIISTSYIGNTFAGGVDISPKQAKRELLDIVHKKFPNAKIEIGTTDAAIRTDGFQRNYETLKEHLAAALEKANQMPSCMGKIEGDPEIVILQNDHTYPPCGNSYNYYRMAATNTPFVYKSALYLSINEIVAGNVTLDGARGHSAPLQGPEPDYRRTGSRIDY